MRAAPLLLLLFLSGAVPPAAAQQVAVFTLLQDTPEACRPVVQNSILPVLSGRGPALTIAYSTSGQPTRSRFQVVVAPQVAQALSDQWDRAVRELRGACLCPPESWLPRERNAASVQAAIEAFLNATEVEHQPPPQRQSNNRFGLLLRPRTERPETGCPELPATVPPGEAEPAGQPATPSAAPGPSSGPSPVAAAPRAVAPPAATATLSVREGVDSLGDLINKSHADILQQVEAGKKDVLNALAEQVAALKAPQSNDGGWMPDAGVVGLLLGATLGATVLGLVQALYRTARGRVAATPEPTRRLVDDVRRALAHQSSALRELRDTLARHEELLGSLAEQVAQRAPPPLAAAKLAAAAPPPRDTLPAWSDAPRQASAPYVPESTALPAPADDMAILRHYNDLVAACGRDSDETAFMEAHRARWAVAEQGNRLRLVQHAPSRGASAFLAVGAGHSRVLIYPAVSFRQAWAAVAGTPAADTVFEGVFQPLHGSGRFRVASAALGRVEGTLVRVDKPGTVEI